MSGHHSCEEEDNNRVAISDAAVDADPQAAAAAASNISSGKTTNDAALTTTTAVVSSPPSNRKAAPDERSSETISVPKSLPTTEPGETPAYITEPGPDDVLLGRGAPIINYEGNVKFRSLVRSRKNDYITSGRHKIKDKVAKSILREIQRRGGRFLKRIEVPRPDATEDLNPKQLAQHQATSDGSSSSQPKDVKVYQVADYDVALEKVKQALRDKDTDQQYLQPPQQFHHHHHQQQQQQQQQNDEGTESSQLGLEEVAAASGISTLTALQQQLYDKMGKSFRSGAPLNHSMSTDSSSSTLFPLSSVPSRNPYHDTGNNNLSLMNELIRHQQLRSLPMNVQGGPSNYERINLLNQQLLAQESHLQDQQSLLAMLRQNSNNVNQKNLQNESLQRPLSPRTMMSLLQQSNNQTLQQSERVSNSMDLERYLLQTSQQNVGDLLSAIGNNNINARNISTHDLLLQQQLSNVSSLRHPSNLFGGQNYQWSQLAANLVAQRQYEQNNTALLAHAASLNETGTIPRMSSNLNLNVASRITRNGLPDSLSLSNHVLGAPSLSDDIGLAQSSSSTNISQIIPLLTRGKVEQHHAPASTSRDTAGSIETTKRKSSKDHGDTSTGSPQLSSSIPTMDGKTSEAVESVKHKKKSKLE